MTTPNNSAAILTAALLQAIAVFPAGNDFLNIITSTYTQVKSSLGIFGGLSVNTAGTASSIALYDGLSSTVTMTIATPGVISWTAHGLVAGSAVKFTTTGAIPTGLTAGTTYYVIAAGLTADTFRVSATPGGAAVNTSGSQSGVHTGWNVSTPIGTWGTAATSSPQVTAQFSLGLIAITADGGGAANQTVYYR